MDIFSDPVLLARVQFALTAAYHFFFVGIDPSHQRNQVLPLA